MIFFLVNNTNKALDLELFAKTRNMHLSARIRETNLNLTEKELLFSLSLLRATSLTLWTVAS